jgi:hypothetical protein
LVNLMKFSVIVKKTLFLRERKKITKIF